MVNADWDCYGTVCNSIVKIAHGDDSYSAIVKQMVKLYKIRMIEMRLEIEWTAPTIQFLQIK